MVRAQKSHSKGNLWDLYSHIVEGRILMKPDGTKGVVCCFKYHDYSTSKFAPVYQVRWEHSRTSMDVPANLVEQWVTDTFANETWVPKKIRAAQLANWHEDKAGAFMDSPLLKVQARHHPEPEPANKKAKLGGYGMQQSIFISPSKPGETRDMAEELHQATQAHLLSMDQLAASRRNCRSVHMSPEGSTDKGQSECAHENGLHQEERHGEGESQGLVGHLKAGLGRLFGSGGGDTGTSPEKGTAKANGSSPPPKGQSNKSPAAAAAVHMGAATTLVIKDHEQRAESGPSNKKAKGAASPAGAKANGKSAGGKGSKGKAEEENDEEEEWVPSWTGKMYPRSLCYRPGDKLVQDLTMDDLSGEFEVERIIDEFSTNSKKAKWFLIKYKGYELRLGNGVNDKGDWETLNNVKDTDAYVQWQKKKPAYFYQAIPKAEKKA